MDTVECPYCDSISEIDLTDCHDAGIKHEAECVLCKKNFVFEVEYSPFLTSSKADCLNGSEHDLDISRTEDFTRYVCKDCSYRKIEKNSEVK